MTVLLETQRLQLRSFEPQDWIHLFQLDNDKEVMRYINGGIATDEATVKNTLLPTFLNYDQHNPWFGFWAAIEKHQGIFLGWFCLRPTNGINNQARIGYRFYPSAWGRGYATEGAKAILDKGFAELGVQTIVAITYEHNQASRRVMEKLGLTKTREFPVDFSNEETLHFDADMAWDGNDVEYRLEKKVWQKSLAKGGQKYD